MAQLSYINTGVKEVPDLSFNIPTDESIGAMLFDISGFDNPFEDYPLLYLHFQDNKIQSIQNMDEALLRELLTTDSWAGCCIITSHSSTIL